MLPSTLQLLRRSVTLVQAHIADLARPVALMLVPVILDVSIGDSVYRSAVVEFLLIAIAIFITIWMEVVIYRVMDAADAGSSPDETKIYRESMFFVAPLFATQILVGLTVGLATLLLIVPGIICAVLFSMTGFVVVFERKRLIDAMRESKNLVYNNFLAVFARLFAANAVYWTVIALVSVGIASLATQSPVGLDQLLVSQSLAAKILSFTIVILNPLLITFNILIYRGLRQIRSTTVTVA